MITISQIQERLKKAIQESGITQTQIANQLNVKQQAISHYVSGKAMPALDTLANLCKILDISADYILNLKDYE